MYYPRNSFLTDRGTPTSSGGSGNGSGSSRGNGGGNHNGSGIGSSRGNGGGSGSSIGGGNGNGSGSGIGSSRGRDFMKYVLSAVVGAVGLLVFTWYKFYRIEDLGTVQKQVMERINIGNISLKDLEDPIAKRTQLMKDLAKALHAAHSEYHNNTYTLIVSGAHGSGKSTAVKKAFEKRGNTVVGKCLGSWDDYLRALVKQLGVDHIPQVTSERHIVEGALAKLRVTPTLIVEMDTRCTPEQLETVLLDIKRLSYEEQLAKFVVVVSSLRILNSLMIGIPELRCDYCQVGNLSKDEAKEFLE